MPADFFTLELCVCKLCDHLDDFEDLSRMSAGEFTEDEVTEISGLFQRDPSEQEMAAIRQMILSRYTTAIGRA